MCYSVQEGVSIRLRRRWETTWIRFVAVSSTFLGAGKVPNVNTVRESRGLAQAPARGGEGAECQLLSLAPRGRQGRARKVNGPEAKGTVGIASGVCSARL